MRNFLDDSQVDAITIEWLSEPARTRASVADDTPHARLLRGFFSLGHWMALDFFAQGVLARAGREVNDSGFRFPGDDGEAAPDGPLRVTIYNPFESAALSEAAFVRVMARLFHAIVEGATRTHDELTRALWWPRFVELAAAVHARADDFR